MFLFFFFYDIAYMPLLVAYAIEILPFKIRSRGFAVMVSEQVPAPHRRLGSVKWACLSASFLELDSVSRPCVQPVCEPVGPGCHEVEIREFPFPSLVLSLRTRLIACGLDSTSSIVGGWSLSFAL